MRRRPGSRTQTIRDRRRRGLVLRGGAGFPVLLRAAWRALGETQAGKSALPASHPLNMGAVGVTGTAAANELAAEADVILAVGTRLQDFTTGSWGLFQGEGRRLVALNVQQLDASKHPARPLVCDAREGIPALNEALASWRADETGTS